MRRVLFGAMLAGAVAGPGLAADLPAAMPTKAPAYVPAFSWTGTYVGLNIGGVWGRTDFDPSSMLNLAPNTVTSYPTVTVNSNSLIGGGQAGYNWQLGSLVLGFEQDFQFLSLKPGFVYGAAPLPPGAPGAPGALVVGDGFSANLKYMGATRAKLGWAWDRVMLYATGGLETGVADGTGNYVARTGGSPALSFTQSRVFFVGWTAGAGVDYAMTNNIFLGLDYRYFDLGSQNFNLGAVTPGIVTPNGAFPGTTSTVAASIHPKGSELLARINIKLNGLGLFGM